MSANFMFYFNQFLTKSKLILVSSGLQVMCHSHTSSRWINLNIWLFKSIDDKYFVVNIHKTYLPIFLAYKRDESAKYDYLIEKIQSF